MISSAKSGQISLSMARLALEELAAPEVEDEDELVSGLGSSKRHIRTFLIQLN